MKLSEAIEIVENEISNICDDELTDAWYTIKENFCDKIKLEKIVNDAYQDRYEDYGDLLQDLSQLCEEEF